MRWCVLAVGGRVLLKIHHITIQLTRKSETGFSVIDGHINRIVRRASVCLLISAAYLVNNLASYCSDH
jgi:hypothetical protein